MAVNKLDDQLGAVQDSGYSTGWDWKGEYVTRLKEDGYERFSQFSATPDTTVLFAGPARFTGLGGNTAELLPIGLVDSVQYQNSPQLQRLFEIGSNRSFFTRGKSAGTMSLSKMLADQQNILRALSNNAYRPEMNIDGPKSPGAETPNPDIMMNLDSEYFAVPFGVMLLFKTRGGNGGNGKILSASYLEYCMFSGYQFSIAAQAPVIVENIGLEFDRMVPVSLTN
jgi:hypothetical protein